MLRVRHIHVGDDVHNAAVRFLRQALVLAAVASFHMENGDMQALGADDRKAAVRIAQHQNCVRLNLYHELVRFRNNIAHRLAQIVAYSVQIHLRIVQLQIMEEDAVQRIIIILACMCQNHVEIFACLFNNGRQTDNLRSGAHDNQKLQLTIVFEAHLAIITHALPPLSRQRYQDAVHQTAHSPTSPSPDFPSATG